MRAIVDTTDATIMCTAPKPRTDDRSQPIVDNPGSAAVVVAARRDAHLGVGKLVDQAVLVGDPP